MSTRVSTLSLHQNSLRDMQNLQSELAKVQRQISSGKTADTFVELNINGKVERVINMEERLQRLNDYINTNLTTTNRLRATDLAVDKILETVSQLKDQITQKRSGAQLSVPLTDLARTGLANIMDNLNGRYEGRYIFAGSQTDNQPVSDIIHTTNIVNGEATGNYYQGDEVSLKSRASDSLEIAYGIKANDPAFRTVIATFHKAIEGDASLDDEDLKEAIDMASDSITELVQLRASINNNLSAINRTNNAHESLKLYFNEVIGEETATNIPEATIKIATNQLTLQAIYQTLARINRLTLTDYLR